MKTTIAKESCFFFFTALFRYLPERPPDIYQKKIERTSLAPMLRLGFKQIIYIGLPFINDNNYWTIELPISMGPRYFLFWFLLHYNF